MNCEKRSAIVTGAAGKGIGRSIALTLAREGAKVIVNYRSNEEKAKLIADYIKSQGGNAFPVKADIFTLNGCKSLVDKTLEVFGQIDICIIGPGAGWHPESVEKLDPTHGMEDLAQEVNPLFYLMPLVLPHMFKNQWGRVIAISSNPDKPSPAYSYNLGKSARTQAILLSSDQVWSKGVTVNVIAPGPVSEIETLENAISQCPHSKEWKNRKNISPQDIAEGVGFLCSEAGQYINGCVISYSFR